MSILYIHTAPLPKIVGTDAVFNEAESLASHFGGKQISLFPFVKPSSNVPRFLLGWHCLSRLMALQKQVKLNHVFAPSLFYYPILKYLSKPIIYSVTAAIRPVDLSSRIERLKEIPQIIVSNDRDVKTLRDHAFENFSMVKPGLDLTRFSVGELPLGATFQLLMASAPWEESQFDTKGIDLLFDVLSQVPQFKLKLLWRGRLLEELHKRIRQKKLSDRVEVINEWVDVTSILSKVHATILLVKNADLVKAYPHSLIESIAMGKPVIISKAIAMADYISSKQCGKVVSDFRRETLLDNLLSLKNNYGIYARSTRELGGADFDQQFMISEIEAIYHKSVLNVH